MSRGVKIGCAAVLALFLLAGIVCATGVFLAQDWFEEVKADYDARRPQMEAEAAAIAVGGADACVVDGVERITACTEMEIKCRAEANVRTQMCFDRAVAPPDFCDGVPEATAIIDATLWGLAECERRGYRGDELCGQFMAKNVPKFCGGH